MPAQEARFPPVIPLGTDAELVQLEPQDAEEIFAVVCANRGHLGQWLPWVESTLAADDTRRFLEQVAANREEGKTAAYSLRLRGALAGLAGLHDIDPANGVAQIGYWLAKPHEGQGWMTRTVQALLGVAFDGLGLERIEIRCAAGNTRSQAIPRRLGFAYEGTLRSAQRLAGGRADVCIYSLLREEWGLLGSVAGREDRIRG